MGVNDYQIGGSHYKGEGDYQHWDWVIDNGLHYLHGCATKYILRWKSKNGVEDLRKAVHYLTKAEDRCIRYYKYETHQKLMIMDDSYRTFYDAIPQVERDIIHAILGSNVTMAQHLLAHLIASECSVGEANSNYTNQG